MEFISPIFGTMCNYFFCSFSIMGISTHGLPIQKALVIRSLKTQYAAKEIRSQYSITPHLKSIHRIGEHRIWAVLDFTFAHSEMTSLGFTRSKITTQCRFNIPNQRLRLFSVRGIHKHKSQPAISQRRTLPFISKPSCHSIRANKNHIFLHCRCSANARNFVD